MQGKTVDIPTAMRRGKRRDLQKTPEGHIDNLIEMAKAHVRAKVERSFHVIK